MNLLASQLSSGLLVCILGMFVCFFGMTLIVLVVSLIGRIMAKQTKTENEQAPVSDNEAESDSLSSQTSQELSPEVVAAITAAITCCLEGSGSNCEFRIRKIKRIN